ncbi:hypothetical protein HMN09_00354800 [Mycena chlorophos]|uniref:Uncharacterized protein n=1 Tax=Mycena chlorophos TaxID=658473 RepID=A0A8H6TJI8_MYCCL|nr:hypothetical protein HMN09_00354800 [Mycena chlorophos]
MATLPTSDLYPPSPPLHDLDHPPPDAPDAVDEENDPPPPYPAPGRRTRTRRPSGRHGHQQHSSAESQSPDEQMHTPLLGQGHDHRASPTVTTGTGRPRAASNVSRSSAVSAAPSLAQTLVGIFSAEEDARDGEPDGVCRLPEDAHGHGDPENGGLRLEVSASERERSRLRRYFRPLTRRVYYAALFHLYVVNFPFALAAFLWAFVLTVTGTTLLIALPIGAVLCFVNILGVRMFARWELAIQSRFYSIPAPHTYSPPPIFIRIRADLDGHTQDTPEPAPTPSFYRSTYATFTAPSTHSALLYFILVKPSLTLVISLLLLVLGVPGIVLVLPAPAVLRAVRRVGMWQAGVAVEGLLVVGGSGEAEGAIRL